MALRRIYGQSSEKADPKQALLFEDMLDKHVPEIAPEGSVELPRSKKKSKRKGHGRRRLPADLPREKVIHDLPEKDKSCPCCGEMRHKGGKSAAIMFGLIATCQRHEVEPYAYLRDVLTRIAATPINRLENLLPDRWQPKTKPDRE